MADPASIEQLAAQAMASQTLPIDTSQLLNPVIEAIKPVMGVVSALVGGLFGLYLIFIISRLYYEHKKVKLMKDIRYDLDYLNQHFGLPYSREKGIRKKIIPLAEMEEIRKEKKVKQDEKEKEKEDNQKNKENKKKEKIKQKKKEAKKAKRERERKEKEEEERKQVLGTDEDRELRL